MSQDKELTPAVGVVRQQQEAGGQQAAGRVRRGFVQLMSAVQRAALIAKRRREAQRRAIEGAAAWEAGDAGGKQPPMRGMDASAGTQAEDQTKSEMKLD